jgi:hypothetical protein
MTRASRVSIVLAAIAALIVVPHALDLFHSTPGAPGTAAGGAALTPAAHVMDELSIGLGLWLLLRNDFAREFFIALSLLGAILILLGSAYESLATVLVLLAFQLTPVALLSTSQVADAFA